MAKQNAQSTSGVETETFNKGLIKDYDDVFYPEGTWSHARNATNFTVGGDIGMLGNETANIICTQAPYTIIGGINLTEDYWVIFSTDDNHCEIGLFIENACQYYTIVNDAVLNFKKSNLIIGVAKKNFDCSYQVYWADNLNPDRTLNIGNLDFAPYEQPWPGVPYYCEDVDPTECIDCQPIYPLRVDPELLRLAKHMSVPCIEIQKGASGGTLQNGSYYAVVAYSVNGQRVTDYFNPSAVQALFAHNDLSGALEITISNLDQRVFDEFELVVVRTVNQQTSAKRIGYYNTQNSVTVYLDYINEALPTVPVDIVPLRSPAYEKSEAIYRNNNYMLRTGPSTKFDFNYQPLANQIETSWVMTEYNVDYYRKGGNITGYMRDEQYAFWIRFVYNTGEKSSSYHIPGRAKEVGREINPDGTDYIPSGLYGPDDVEFQQTEDQGGTYVQPKYWEMVNTAYVTSYTNISDGSAVVNGKVLAKGKMGYWESTEMYPNNRPDIWNANVPGEEQFNLCGKPIRHHKMPSDIVNITRQDSNGNDLFSRVRVDGNTPKAIRILGVSFGNISVPRYNDGTPIPGIVGYEILRSSREGNKTVIAKGIINNMRSYKDPDGQNIYYQNYPYNYRGQDSSLTSLTWQDEEQLSNGTWNRPQYWLKDYRKDLFTFHSPDTSFKYPFLSAQELKLYGEVGNSGNITGNFEPVPGHPKHKLPTNLAFFVAATVGIGVAAVGMRGKETRSIDPPTPFNAGIASIPLAITSTSIGLQAAQTATRTLWGSTGGVFEVIPQAVTGYTGAATETYMAALQGLNGSLSAVNGGIGSALKTSYSEGLSSQLPIALRIPAGILTYANYMTQGTDDMLDIILKFTPFRQYALRYISHASMFKHKKGNVNSFSNSRRYIKNSGYLSNQFQSIANESMNNLFRGNTVVLNTSLDVNDPQGTDNSLQTVSTAISNNLIGSSSKYHFDSFNTTTHSYYAGLKIRIRNQYGQMNSIRQITTGCTLKLSSPTTITTDITRPLVKETPIIYGGDVYIGRYTEKNTFFYFYDWLMDQPDGTEFDYRYRSMITNPRYWADFTKFDTAQFVSGFFSKLASLQFRHLLDDLPSNNFNLDNDPIQSINNFFSDGNEDSFGGFRPFQAVRNAINKIAGILKFSKKDAYFYLFQSGVRDFFVESEINVDYRDWGNAAAERHYDPHEYTDLRLLFAPDIIKSGNYFKYDISLSNSRVFNNFISWGAMQPRYYDPFSAETCYVKYNNRIIYSLPQQDEAVKDNWKVFLAHNYKDFSSRVTAVKPIGRNGALILFENDSPAQFLGVDTLETSSGTKLTIGDGGLFSQPMQFLSNSDKEFQHGACQNRLSITNTPTGIYYMSQSQGKVFAITDKGLEEISAAAMRWWFNRYLPYLLTIDFPDFQLTDNPVAGIGCQSVFDNTNQILYFSKRDYRVRRDITNTVTYAPSIGPNMFLVDNALQVKLGDPAYFENCSWTISYDPKNQMWISFHDWIPELGLSSKNYFLTTQTDADNKGGIWRHNIRTDLYANYYGIDYPFEVEYIAQTGQNVNTLRNIEYNLECYTYDVDGIDTYHVLDFNFDHAIVHNTEQVSGVLNLNLNPKNNPVKAMQYPKINPNSIDVIYSKEEQKYRFNQFWDITRDRGEFTYPNVQQPIWSTELNGFRRFLNPNNLNYTKSAFERKKFRHYTSHVLLWRNVSGPVKMLFKLSNNKDLYSPR